MHKKFKFSQFGSGYDNNNLYLLIGKAPFYDFISLLSETSLLVCLGVLGGETQTELIARFWALDTRG